MKSSNTKTSRPWDHWQLAVLVTAMIVLSGCAFGNSLNLSIWRPAAPPTVPTLRTEDPGAHSPMLAGSYAAADRLAAMLAAQRFDPAAPILVSSFVSINDVTKSTTMGRMLAEQIGSRMAQRGYRIVETKLRKHSLAVRPQKGEFALSRQYEQLNAERDAHAVLTGTYAVSRRVVHVSCRVIDVQSGALKAAWDMELPRRSMMMSMLTGQQPDGSY